MLLEILSTFFQHILPFFVELHPTTRYIINFCQYHRLDVHPLINLYLTLELQYLTWQQQNEKIRMIPDPFALDWDALSETEMKRLVQQLETTLVEIRFDKK